MIKAEDISLRARAETRTCSDLWAVSILPQLLTLYRMGDLTAQQVSAVSFSGMQFRQTAPSGQCFRDWSNLV